MHDDVARLRAPARDDARRRGTCSRCPTGWSRRGRRSGRPSRRPRRSPPPTPAHATSACTGPSARAARAMASSTALRSRMSHGDVTRRPGRSTRPSLERRLVEPEQRHRRAVLREPTATARPIPVPAPVTTTCLCAISSPPLRNLREKRAGIPLAPPALVSIEFRLRRARDATRTKPSRETVRGSGRSPGGVDESAPGSANSWSRPF